MIFSLDKIITGHAGAIYDTIVDDSGFLFTTSADKFIARWNLEKGEQEAFAIKLDHPAYSLALINEDKHLLIGSSRGNVHVIDLEQKQEIKNLAQHKTGVFSLCYNAKKSEFYATDAEGYFSVWSAEDFSLKLILPLNCGKIRSMTLADEGELLILSCQDGTTRILECNFYNEIVTLKSHRMGANVALVKDEVLYTGGKDAYIRLWDWKSEKLIKEVPAHNYAVYDLIDMGDTLVSASFDKTIKVWEPGTLEILQRIDAKSKGHTHTVNSLSKISSTEFISAGDDRKIKLWIKS
ncbi:WD-40 repeat-containing protein [Lishizhenia tianjinensis]|uniref:WD-40 repeat-containing protein n=1 Tax=Lishizhenia tianjinensis TaxID=477690 RepID=A0A1I6YP98_9FLAO|nr:hypothetical protein [Lishizhenia tianjinensis]SFT52118.1 WD-40 repeat-containing protein [Lishizhenia tianjinensis]